MTSMYEHGTWRRYLYESCRCPECLDAYREYQRHQKETFPDRLDQKKTRRRARIPQTTPQTPGAISFTKTAGQRRRKAP